MLAFQLGLLALCALVSMAFGLRYLVAREFMAYHAIVAGRAWQQVDTGLQTILLGMLRIIGGGLLTYGVALLWLLWPLSQRQAWAAGAAFTLTLTAVVPTLYVVVWLRRKEPGAPTPVVPAAVVLALAVVGSGASLLQ